MDKQTDQILHSGRRQVRGAALGDSSKRNTERSKLNIMWPPSMEAPKKSFSIEEEVKVNKAKWPPDTSEEEVTSTHLKPATGDTNQLHLANGHSSLWETEKKKETSDSQLSEQHTMLEESKKGKIGDSGIVQRKTKEIEDLERKAESGKKVKECDNLPAQSAVKEKDEKMNEVDIGDIIPVTNTDEDDVLQDNKNNNNNNNSNYCYKTAFPPQNIWRQEASTDDMYSPLSESSYAKTTAHEYAFESPERHTVNSKVLSLTDSEVGYSTEVSSIACVEENIKRKGTISSGSVIRHNNKDATCHNPCSINVDLREVANTMFPFDSELLGTGEAIRPVKKLNTIPYDNLKAFFVPGNDSIGLLGSTATTQIASSPHSKNFVDHDINICQNDGRMEMLQKGTNANAKLPGCRAAQSSQKDKVKTEQPIAGRKSWHDEN